ncbi:MAG: DEAD/DEAH box helicase [Patescibacteria group bacterium]
MHTQQQSGGGFHSLTIAPTLLERITHLGYTTPTPIQHKSIPPLIEGKDVLGIAQTGTGKTLAFAVPMIQRIAKQKCRGLVIVPTRELALQVNETFEKVGKSIGLRTAVLIGGADIKRQIKTLQANPHVIVGTPGRINDHLERKSVHMEKVKILVLDEADLMLDMGFEPQIKRILEVVPKDRQTMLFSATMPPAIHTIASRYMSSPLRIEVAKSGTLAEKIQHELRYVSQTLKVEELKKVLHGASGTTIVFVRTKHTAKKLAYALQLAGIKAAEIHSNRSLAQRRAALDGFKSGKYHVLVATDIAARGIDVIGVSMVLNFDLPENPEDYVHRIGRTGRAGMAGHALSFVAPGQQGLVKQIERVTRTSLPIAGNSVAEKLLSRKPILRKPISRKPYPQKSFTGTSHHGKPRSEHEVTLHEMEHAFSKKSKSWKGPSGSHGFARGKKNGFHKQSGSPKQRTHRW